MRFGRLLAAAKKRIIEVLGGDPYYDNVVSLLHFDNNYTDVKGKTWTGTGSWSFSSTEKKFGTHSLYCLREFANPVLSTPDSADWDFGSGDFTVEVWAFPMSSGVGSFLGQYVTFSNYSFYFSNNVANNGIRMSAYIGGVVHTLEVTNNEFAPNVWHHIALVRSGSSLMQFVDGYLTAITTVSGAIGNPSSNFIIGRTPESSFPWEGRFDEFRATKGVARYSGTTVGTKYFDPPTNDFPNSLLFSPDPFYSNVSCLMHFDNNLTCQKGRTFTAPHGSYESDVFGDAITLSVPSTYTNTARLAYHSSMDVSGNADFTIEFRAKHNSAGKISHWMYFNQQGAGGSQYWAPIVFWFGGTWLMLYGSNNGSSWNVYNGLSIHTPIAGQWYHYAVVRSGSSLTVYVDGVAALVQTAPAMPSGWYGGTTLGPFETSTAGATVSFDEFRFTNNVARYTTNFTPLTEAFPNQ